MISVKNEKVVKPFMGVNLGVELTNNVPYRPQETENWCWAACVQMIVATHQSRYPTQCALANMAFGYQDCCADPLPARCNEGYDDLCNLFEQLQFNCRYQQSHLTFTEVVNQVDTGQPLIYKLIFHEGTLHTGIISGAYYDEQNDIRYVYFLDPDESFFNEWGIPPYGWVPYDWIITAYGVGNWYGSFYDLAQP